MPDLQKPGMVDLLKQLGNFAGVPSSVTGPTTATDQAAISKDLDPTSPDVLKQIALQLTQLKQTGSMPNEQTAKELGAVLKTHLNYNANMTLLKELNSAYTAKYASKQTQGQ